MKPFSSNLLFIILITLSSLNAMLDEKSSVPPLTSHDSSLSTSSSDTALGCLNQPVKRYAVGIFRKKEQFVLAKVPWHTSTKHTMAYAFLKTIKQYLDVYQTCEPEGEKAYEISEFLERLISAWESIGNHKKSRIILTSENAGSHTFRRRTETLCSRSEINSFYKHYPLLPYDASKENNLYYNCLLSYCCARKSYQAANLIILLRITHIPTRLPTVPFSSWNTQARQEARQAFNECEEEGKNMLEKWGITLAALSRKISKNTLTLTHPKKKCTIL